MRSTGGGEVSGEMGEGEVEGMRLGKVEGWKGDHKGFEEGGSRDVVLRAQGRGG